MKYLLTTTEVYKVETDGEAQALIAAAKAENTSELLKYDCKMKEVKQKGEVVDSYFLVSLTRRFNAEKEPESEVTVTYEVE